MPVPVLEGDEVEIVEVEVADNDDEEEDDKLDDDDMDDEDEDEDDGRVEVGWELELGIEVSLENEEDIAEVVTLIMLDDDGVTLGREEVAVETGELRPP